MLIHVLTPGFSCPNGCAFLMPLILHNNTLRDAGMDIRYFSQLSNQLSECDALMIDCKYYSARWAKECEQVLEEIVGLVEKIRFVIFVDIFDSASWDSAKALPYVTLYCKSQLLKDRSAYLRPLYGYRNYSDYYHKHCNATDDLPVYSEPIKNSALLDKLIVSWNSGLADYSWLGPYRMNSYHHLNIKTLLRFPNSYSPPSIARKKDLSCRIGTRYIRNSVSYQRKKLVELLAKYLETSKLSRRRYLNELQQSKIAISPFGLGEITLRDFEIFMNGALLFKPDMSSVETWPNFYADGETMIAHRWDLQDVVEKIEVILSDYENYLCVAEEGQNRYRQHLCGPEADALFTERFSGIMAACERLTS